MTSHERTFLPAWVPDSKDEAGNSLYRRNFVAVVVITLLLTALFTFIGANYFHDKGFIDRFGAISAILTGFYIAALVGVASFSTGVADLDEDIELGRIYRIVDGEKDYLNRRQYVCAMFGYLAFISLFISLAAVVFVTMANFMPDMKGLWPLAGRAAVILLINLVLAHMIVTTCHGLYYLIDRLYYKKAKLLPKPKPGKGSSSSK